MGKYLHCALNGKPAKRASLSRNKEVTTSQVNRQSRYNSRSAQMDQDRTRTINSENEGFAIQKNIKILIMREMEVQSSHETVLRFSDADEGQGELDIPIGQSEHCMPA